MDTYFDDPQTYDWEKEERYSERVWSCWCYHNANGKCYALRAIVTYDLDGGIAEVNDMEVEEIDVIPPEPEAYE